MDKREIKRIMICVVIAGMIIGFFWLNGDTTFNFRIKGKWKNVGTETFGQAQSGSIITFDGQNCNLYSPYDTYAFYKDGGEYYLDVTGALFSENRSFRVKVIDKDNIEIYSSYVRLVMKRVG